MRVIAVAGLLASVFAAPVSVAAEEDSETPLSISVGFGVGKGDQTGDSGFTTTGYMGVAQSESGDFPKEGWRLDLEILGPPLGESELEPRVFVHTGFTGNFETRDGGHVINEEDTRPPEVFGQSEVLVDWFIGPGVQFSVPLPLVERPLRIKPSVVLGIQSVEGTLSINEVSGKTKRTKQETFVYLGPTLELNVPLVSSGRWGLSAYMSGNTTFFVGDRTVSVMTSGDAGVAKYKMKMDRFVWAYHGGIRLEFGVRGGAP
jgi:hypothetical protein